MSTYGVIGLLVGLFLLLQLARVLIPVVARARDQRSQEELDPLERDARDEDSPVVKLALRVIEDAYARGAESIHVGPGGEESSDDGRAAPAARVSYRIDGRLEERMKLPLKAAPALVGRFRVMAGLGASHGASLSQGRIELRGAHPEAIDVDLDLATWGTSEGPCCVLRLRAKGAISVGLDALEVLDEPLARLRRAMTAAHGGVLLVAGATGSGRTTTLHAVLHDLEPGRSVAHVAPDPYVPWVEGVDASNLDALDADVVIVGELDDPARARLAFAAAQRGLLVVATIFARDVGTAIARLFDDVQVSPHIVAACLHTVVAQRLCRRVCKCRADGAPARADCPRCEGKGYRGRVALQEVATVEGPLLDALRAGETSPQALQAAALAGGMTPLERDGLLKAERGTTDLAAVRAALA